MGKGTIVSHIGSGKYDVTLKIDRSRAEALIAAMTTKISEYDSVILPGLSKTRNRAYNYYRSATGKLNRAIDDLNNGLITLDGMAQVIEQANATRITYDDADRKYKNAQLARNSLQSQRDFIQANLPTDPTVQAWCADLTENLSGDVGTIEIPNERIHDVLIRPGHGGGAAYNSTRDGQFQATVSGTPASAFYNFAMFPGWAKWMPTYRVGTITSKTGDNCDVTLDAAVSSQGFDVNANTTLTNVPIVYIDCNGEPFQVNDRVIVEFINQDYTDPRVIGFETNPKGCRLDVFTFNILGESWYKLRRHDAISATILSSCQPGSLNLNNIQGMTYNWNNDKIYFHDFISSRVYYTGDITGGNECIITGWLSSFPLTQALAFDGTDLWSAYYISGTGLRIRQHVGVSSTVNQTWTLSTNLRVQSMTYIGSGLFALGIQDFGASPYARVYIYSHSGASFTYQSGFVWPPGAVDGPFHNSAGPYGISIYKGNLITWGGRKQQTPPRYQYLTLHSGISATISEQYSIDMIHADGLVYPDAIT